MTCGCAVEFRPTHEALHAALADYQKLHPDGLNDNLVFTYEYALDKYQVTSIFHWPRQADPLGWWFFAEEREVTPEILRVIRLQVLIEKDPSLARMLELDEGKKAFREENSQEWTILDID